MTTAEIPARLPAQMLTAADAARVLNLSLRSVRRLIKEKKLPAIRIGRLVRPFDQGADVFSLLLMFIDLGTL